MTPATVQQTAALAGRLQKVAAPSPRVDGTPAGKPIKTPSGVPVLQQLLGFIGELYGVLGALRGLLVPQTIEMSGESAGSEVAAAPDGTGTAPVIGTTTRPAAAGKPLITVPTSPQALVRTHAPALAGPVPSLPGQVTPPPHVVFPAPGVGAESAVSPVFPGASEGVTAATGQNAAAPITVATGSTPEPWRGLDGSLPSPQKGDVTAPGSGAATSVSVDATRAEVQHPAFALPTAAAQVTGQAPLLAQVGASLPGSPGAGGASTLTPGVSHLIPPAPHLAGVGREERASRAPVRSDTSWATTATSPGSPTAATHSQEIATCPPAGDTLVATGDVPVSHPAPATGSSPGNASFPPVAATPSVPASGSRSLVPSLQEILAVLLGQGMNKGTTPASPSLTGADLSRSAIPGMPGAGSGSLGGGFPPGPDTASGWSSRQESSATHSSATSPLTTTALGRTSAAPAAVTGVDTRGPVFRRAGDILSSTPVWNGRGLPTPGATAQTMAALLGRAGPLLHTSPLEMVFGGRATAEPSAGHGTPVSSGAALPSYDAGNSPASLPPTATMAPAPAATSASSAHASVGQEATRSATFPAPAADRGGIPAASITPVATAPPAVPGPVSSATRPPLTSDATGGARQFPAPAGVPASPVATGTFPAALGSEQLPAILRAREILAGGLLGEGRGTGARVPGVQQQIATLGGTAFTGATLPANPGAGPRLGVASGGDGLGGDQGKEILSVLKDAVKELRDIKGKLGQGQQRPSSGSKTPPIRSR